MTSLSLRGVQKSHAGNRVLHGVDLDVPAGTVVALLGASGCGKTTLLRLIAGFEPAEAGRIVLGDRVLEAPGIHVPAERRQIGYVPQEGTLFPHLTVRDNVGFGLTRAERRGGRVGEMLQLTGLTGLEHRYPHQISGGQQQRTALARALAPGPGLVLLDEPFAALDHALRRSVCADVVSLLRATGTTAILVTHDPQEAFVSADRVAVMLRGGIGQFADPMTLYRRPADAEIARLTGATIFLPATHRDGLAETVLGRVKVQPDLRSGSGTVLLRPEQITLAGPGTGVACRLLSSVFRGYHSGVTVLAGDTELEILLPGWEQPGDVLHLQIQGDSMFFEDVQGRG
jgi:iron(III) transport system ATP-binding protein